MHPLSSVWGPAQPLGSVSCEGPLWKLASPTITKERSYDRTILRFSAPGQRLLGTAAYELYNVYAVLLDAHGRVIVRRGHESSRQALLGELCTWAHELYDDHLAQSAALAYELEVRIDLRRTLVAGPLAAVDFDSEARQAWSILGRPSEPDPLMSASFSPFYSRGYFELMMAATSPVLHDGHRSELEVLLHDEAGKVLAAKWMGFSVASTGIGYGDTSLSLEKRIARQVTALTINARTEARVVTRLGPIATDSIAP